MEMTVQKAESREQKAVALRAALIFRTPQILGLLPIQALRISKMAYTSWSYLP
jgi:hypothetical protein